MLRRGIVFPVAAVIMSLVVGVCAALANPQHLNDQQQSEIQRCVLSIESELSKDLPSGITCGNILYDSKNPKILSAYKQLIGMGPEIIQELCKYLDLPHLRHDNIAQILIQQFNRQGPCDGDGVLDAVLAGVVRTGAGLDCARQVLSDIRFDGRKIFRLFDSKDARIRSLALSLVGSHDDYGRCDNWNGIDWAHRPFFGLETESETVDAIRRIALSEPDERIRSEAVGALYYIGYGDERTIEFLNSHLFDDSGGTADKRKVVLDDFQKMLTSKKVNSRVAAILGEMIKHDSSAKIREEAARFMGQLKLEEGVPALLAGLHDSQLIVKESCAASNLNFRSSASKSLPFLKEILSNHSDVKEAASFVEYVGRQLNFDITLPVLLEAGKTTKDDQLQRSIATTIGSSCPREPSTQAALEQVCQREGAIALLLGWMDSNDSALRSDSRVAILYIKNWGVKLTKEEQIRFDLASTAHFARFGSQVNEERRICGSGQQPSPLELVRQSATELLKDVSSK